MCQCAEASPVCIVIRRAETVKRADVASTRRATSAGGTPRVPVIWECGSPAPYASAILRLGSVSTSPTMSLYRSTI